jgi:hypothetical protein
MFVFLGLISNVFALEQAGVCLLQGSSRIGSLVRAANGVKSPSTNQKSQPAKNDNDKESMSVEYEPDRWNQNPAVLRSHNCYEYSLNDLDDSAAHHCEGMLHNDPANKKQCRRWFHIPGYRYHQHDLHEVVRFNKTSITCDNMLERVALDGKGALLWSGPDNQPTKEYGAKTGKSWKHDDHCPNGAYMASLVVQPEKRFHFYRRDHLCLNPENKNKRCWSHKPGILNATRFDAKGDEIVDLFKADRRYGKHAYNKVCGFFCVPSNKLASTHSEFYRGDKSNWKWAVV